jgi:quercetin dioxygenase-like cupin family protein
MSIMKKILLSLIVVFICIVGKSQYNKEITIESLLKTDTTSIGQKISYPLFPEDEVTISKITIPPGKSTGWHKHVFPVFAYVLKGTLTVELEDNKTRLFPENSSFSEVINTFHNGINNGTEDVVLIAFFMGGKGIDLSVHKDKK